MNCCNCNHRLTSRVNARQANEPKMMSKHGMAQANSQGLHNVCFKSISEETNVDQISYFKVKSKVSIRHIIKKKLTKEYASKHLNNFFVKVNMD